MATNHIIFTCSNCFSTGNSLAWCSRCRAVKYCNERCQRADWPVHKEVCDNNGYANAFKKKLNTLLQNVKFNMFIAALLYHFARSRPKAFIRCLIVPGEVDAEALYHVNIEFVTDDPIDGREGFYSISFEDETNGPEHIYTYSAGVGHGECKKSFDIISTKFDFEVINTQNILKMKVHKDSFAIISNSTAKTN